ncbi:hypothetical protein G6F64_013783 [Rhizopus arrhizus]|uniref:Uncharacterized protein n=1 Tax=Rhizopus oryzae TaxID=64495 RepID=A0A9P6WVA5_RHIOR|nr:hypothetical protein G6F64_013783 [Rhizopus arrhizus]
MSSVRLEWRTAAGSSPAHLAEDHVRRRTAPGCRSWPSACRRARARDGTRSTPGARRARTGSRSAGTPHRNCRWRRRADRACRPAPCAAAGHRARRPDGPAPAARRTGRTR